MVKQYLDHSFDILTSKHSQVKGGSKGVGLISKFGYQNEYDLGDGFPLTTTKKTAYRSAFGELMWMMRGETNIRGLLDEGIPVWNGDAFQFNQKALHESGVISEVYTRNSPEWQSARDEYAQRVLEDSEFAERFGDAGRIYGAQWRSWRSVDVDESGNAISGTLKETDQIEGLFDAIRKNPYGKKHIVTAWNPGELKQQSMPPCHMEFQVSVANENELDLMMKQRSCDMFLGVPFNIAQYSMLTHLFARELEMKPRRFIHTFGDAHFYTGAGERSQWYIDNFDEFQSMVGGIESREGYLELKRDLENRILPPEPKGQEKYDHVTGILAQMSRESRDHSELVIADKPMLELRADDFKINGYDPHPGIVRKMAA